MLGVTGDAKGAARRGLRAHRRELLGHRDREADARALAEAAVAAVRGHVGPGVCRVAAYEARPTEPPTHRLIDALEAAGHEVVVPITLPDLSLDWTRPGPVVPLGAAALRTARVVITPGLAVTRSGTRLGQGGGSYDRALAGRGRGTLVVTLLYDDELVEGPLPADPHDMPVDAVITPGRGLVSCRPSG